MASAVDICNLALARIGDIANVQAIDPPEDSAQGAHCARFYPMARESMLESYDWAFSRARITLTPIDTDDVTAWAYTYAMPTTALRAINVLIPESESPQEFELERDASGVTAIRTNAANAVLRYTLKVTDTALYSPLFIDALAWLLASYLAGPIIKGDAGAAMAKNCLQAYLLAFAKATASDANQGLGGDDHAAPWIEDR